MYRTCVLALLALCAGLARSFSWDIAIGTTTLEFYTNEGTLTYSMTPTSEFIYWITYDPFNNRILFIESQPTNSRKLRQVYSFDIATQKRQSLIRINLTLEFMTVAYDPATGLLFGAYDNKIYSFLAKSGSNNEIDGNLVIVLQKETDIRCVVVDSCGGYIYWGTFDHPNVIERVRFNGSEREVIIDKSENTREYLTIDSQAHKIYWVEYQDFFEDFIIMSADMNGKNQRQLYFEHVTATDYSPGGLTVSKDFIYWIDWRESIFWQLPKNLQRDTVKSKKIVIDHAGKSEPGFGFFTIAAKYAIEEQTLGIPLCKALKCPNNSATKDCDSLNAPSDVNLLCVHGTKVSGESRCECTRGYSGERCEASVCHNYCLHGDCSASAEGKPKCRCIAGYSGERCEVDACQGYCLNNGDCSLNEGKPECHCSGGYDGERCHFPVFLSKSYEQFKC